MSESKVQKRGKSRGQRFLRLIISIFDPRALAHGLQVLNYYNYSHVQERRRASIGAGCGISPVASFANGHNITIGDKVNIGAHSSLWAGPDQGKITIGNHVLFAPSVMMTATNYRFNDGSPVTEQALKEGSITVGNDVWIGYGAVILPGTTIGDGAIIGAGAIVRGDVPANAIITSPEAQIIGTRFARPPSPEAVKPGSDP